MDQQWKASASFINATLFQSTKTQKLRTRSQLLNMFRVTSALIRQLREPLYQSQRRCFHPEPRSFISSQHATHRALYRWTLQAIGTPLLVAYLCDKVSERSNGGDSSWKLDLPKIEAGLLTEPLKMPTQVWGQLRFGEVRDST